MGFTQTLAEMAYQNLKTASPLSSKQHGNCINNNKLCGKQLYMGIRAMNYTK